MKRVAVILAGGKGSRLYPLSTEEKPKQFLKLLSDKMMIEDTVDRIRCLFDRDSIFINTLYKYRHYVEGLPYRFVFEKKRSGTTNGVKIIVDKLLNEFGDCIITLIPSDHYIGEDDLYISALESAIDIAINENNVILIGIKPHEVDTGYGYIQHRNGKVIEFKEKPDLELANEYVECGYLWNSGIFIFRASLMRGLYERYVNDASITGVFEKDIIEKTDNLSVVSGHFAWSDIGDIERYNRIVRKEGEGDGKTIKIDKRIDRRSGKVNPIG